MPKQFGQMKPEGFDPNRVKAPLAGDQTVNGLWAGGEGSKPEMPDGGTKPIPERLEGPQILMGGAGPLTKPDSANMQEADPVRGPSADAPDLMPKKKKKFDWKTALQDGINSYEPDEEDAMDVFAQMRNNESQYMNRPIY